MGIRNSAAAILTLLAAGCAFGQAPSIDAGGITNAASFAAGQAVAPGSLVAIFGKNLATQTTVADSIPLATQHPGGVSVTFNGVKAPLSFSTPGHNETATLCWTNPRGAVGS